MTTHSIGKSLFSRFLLNNSRMGEFLNKVREGKIAGPQQRKFTQEQWRSDFEQYAADTEDSNLFLSGVWFYEQFGGIRTETEKVASSFCLKEIDAQALLVGFATMQCKQLELEVNRRLKENKDESVFIQELLNRPIKTLWGAEIDGDSLNEALVDGIRFALDTIYQLTPTSKADKLSDDKKAATVPVIYLLGISYNLFYSLWQECVWNTAHIRIVADKICLCFQDELLEKQRIASFFRYEAIQLHGFNLVSSQEKNVSNSKEYLENVKVFSARRKASRFQIKAVSAYQFRNSIPLINPGSITHIMSFADDLLRIEHKELEGLSIFKIIHAYNLLSQVARTILPQLDSAIAKKVIEIANFSPILDRGELVKAFKDALFITDKQCDFLLSLMTFNRTPREQLWFRPLLQKDGTQFTFLAPALLGIQYARLLHYICSRIPDFESKMLKRFEIFTRTQLAKAVEDGILSNDCYVYNSSLKLCGEEIDLVFAVGTRFFICELKATLFSAEPIEQFRERENLRKKALTQIKRKLAVVESNREAFIDKIKHPRIKRGDVFSLHPVIITNNQYLSGFPYEGVPVIDDLILSRYFDKGYSAHGKTNSETGELEPVNLQHFYKTTHEGISNFPGYISKPPQISDLFDHVKMKVRPIVADRSIFVCDFSVENLRVPLSHVDTPANM